MCIPIFGRGNIIQKKSNTTVLCFDLFWVISPLKGSPPSVLLVVLLVVVLPVVLALEFRFMGKNQGYNGRIMVTLMTNSLLLKVTIYSGFSH